MTERGRHSSAPRRPGETRTAAERIRETIREAYGGASAETNAHEIALRIGYTPEQLASIPPAANFGYGCGNPVLLAKLVPGEVVLDLGSGSGIDVLLAARAVGRQGRATGIDMTPQMLRQANAAAGESGFDAAEFHEATIEALPCEDASIDVVLSNGVLNLSPERERALREAHRVLRPDGRLVLSDLAIEGELDPAMAHTAQLYLGTLLTSADYVVQILSAGFREVEISREFAYGRRVLAHNTGFARVAAQEGVARESLESFFDQLASFELRARK